MRAQKTFAELRCQMIQENINQKELAEISGIANAPWQIEWTGAASSA